MLTPVNRYLVVQKEQKKEKESGILLPSDVKIDTTPFTVVQLLKAHSESNLKTGVKLVVPSHVIEEINFNNSLHYVVSENHIIGFFE
jgi:co-chaperonin GroES (HSP10)